MLFVFANAAKKAKNSAQLATTLQNEAGIDCSSAAGKKFAEQVFANAPNQTASRALQEQQQRKADAAKTRKELELNEKYRMLMDDIDRTQSKSSKSSSSSKSKSDTKLTKPAKQFRKPRDNNDDDGDDDDGDDRNDDNNVAAATARNDDGGSASTKSGKKETDDEKYAREAKEIAEFEERLKDRDKRKTKKVIYKFILFISVWNVVLSSRYYN